MHAEEDTIAAVATPVGQGGIGIVRISGPRSLDITSQIFSPKKKVALSGVKSGALIYGHILSPDDRVIIDEVLVAVMRAPRSYTREDIAEIHCHGGMVAVRKILGLITSFGARLADPGEFTKRAFLNGRISLDQAEAVLDLITARTEESLRIAAGQLQGGLSERLAALRSELIGVCAAVEAVIDFPEDEIEIRKDEQLVLQMEEVGLEIRRLSQTFQEARFFREGLSVAIIGKPNVGKSSLLNALLRKDRAIVTEVPGTTRDLIEEHLNIQGLPVRIIDTAGIRESHELVEQEGIRRSLQALEQADFVIAVIDGSRSLDGHDHGLLEKVRGKEAVIVVSKTDLPLEVSLENIGKYGKQYIRVSVVSGEGLEDLKTTIYSLHLKDWKEEREGVLITNMRHKTALDHAALSLGRAVEIISGNRPLEIAAIELRDAADQIGGITGAVTTAEVLERIFSDFCIGK